MSKDVRKEQLVLLRFEKQLAALAATVAAGIGTAQAAEAKLENSIALDAYDEIQKALIQLADVTTNAHYALNEQAMSVGAQVMMVSGGRPKRVPGEAIRSLFGIG